MYSLEDLTNIVFNIRKCNAKDNNMLLNVLEIIEDLYKQDKWVYYPSNHDENGNNFFVGTDFPIGKCLIFYTDKKFIQKGLGTDIIISSIRKIFDVFIESKEFDGIVMNAGSEAELYLQKQVIEVLELNK